MGCYLGGMISKNFELFILLLLNFLNSTEPVGLKNNVKLENVQICPENDLTAGPIRNLKFSKINETHSILSMDYYYPRDLDEHTSFEVHLDRWSDGRWVEWPFLPRQKDMCKTMLKLFPAVWVEMNKSSNMTSPEKCPVPAGYYHLENHIFDFSGIHAPLRLGRFRVTTKVTDDDTNQIIYCLITIVSLEQQVTGIRN